jgi:hypothetical protein
MRYTLHSFFVWWFRDHHERYWGVNVTFTDADET